MLGSKAIYLVIQWEAKFIHSAQKSKEVAENIAKGIEKSMGWKMEVKEVLYNTYVDTTPLKKLILYLSSFINIIEKQIEDIEKELERLNNE
ncbi:hypothetical protein LCGC14_0223070 [marine sediment metagenome]|uniref:Uncharacterized protein n=1 Tax=marine sediment metagenome TaxID=412755 RepID=A0A0F9UGB7_9ZZZZ|nr:hypothetical protein [bacterium]